MEDMLRYRRRPRPRAAGCAGWKRSAPAPGGDGRRFAMQASQARHVLTMMHRALDDVARQADAASAVARKLVVAQAGVAALMEMLGDERRTAA